ncbi:hypothetical protein LTR51_004640 [Lithohypha guttulata]|nr:hypothetical protein LTR51_004640 [Lithohypha guttulata]
MLGGTGLTRAFSPRRTTVQVAVEEASREHSIYSDSDPGSTTNASSVSVRLYDEGEFFNREELGEKLSAPKKKRKCGRKSKNKKKARDILTTSTDRPKPPLPFENDAGEDAPPLDLSGTRHFRPAYLCNRTQKLRLRTSNIAAPESPLDHPLAPNLAKPDDLNARIRENFKPNNAEERETVRNDSKNFPAILLGKDLGPITEHDGEKINTSVKLRIDEVRPHIHIVASRKSKEDYNLADQFMVSKELGEKEQKEARRANPHLVRPYVVE